MDNNRIVDKRSVRLEELMKKDYIPFLGGRPNREKIIGPDDIMNLIITLNLESSAEEFEKKL
jgi:hypothetical protein